jgi:two-component system, cell cycle response regulator CpdR
MTEKGELLGKRILLADDVPEVRQAIKMMLGIDHHEVAEASNGAEALELFQQKHFDLVITDYVMPVMKGDELAQRIKHLEPSQPVLMITGSLNESDRRERSVDAILNKPIGFQDLRQAVQQLTGAVTA